MNNNGEGNMDRVRGLRSFVVAVVLAAVAALSGCAAIGTQGEARAPRNIIILFGDGAAATQWELGRYTSQLIRKQPYVITDVILKAGNVGLLTVHSADAFVTDS